VKVDTLLAAKACRRRRRRLQPKSRKPGRRRGIQ